MTLMIDFRVLFGIYFYFIMIMKTSNQKGDLAVYKTVVRAIEKGYAVNIPAQHCRYDLLLDDGDQFYRVQVKYADGKPSSAEGSILVKLAYETRKRRKVYTYSADEVDALVVYLPRIERLCWFPLSVFGGKKILSVRIRPPLNGQVGGINLASDYYW